MRAYFGDWGWAPINEGAEQRPTPVGDLCHLCEERVAEGDRGTWLGGVKQAVGGGYITELLVQHAECGLMNVLGHVLDVLGRCPGPGNSHDVGLTRREEALWVWAHTHGENPPLPASLHLKDS